MSFVLDFPKFECDTSSTRVPTKMLLVAIHSIFLFTIAIGTWDAMCIVQ